MGVSKNNGTPKSSILIGFSIINHPFWGTPIFGNTHILSTSLNYWTRNQWPKRPETRKKRELPTAPLRHIAFVGMWTDVKHLQHGNSRSFPQKVKIYETWPFPSVKFWKNDSWIIFEQKLRSGWKCFWSFNKSKFLRCLAIFREDSAILN